MTDSSDNEFNESSPAKFKPNLKYLWLSFKKRWFWMLPIIAVFTGLALYIALNIHPQYEARTVMIKHTKNMSVNPDLYYEPSMRTILETVKLRANLLKLKNQLEIQDDVENLFKWIHVKQGNRNDIIQVLVTHPDPQLAADVANRTSKIFQDSTSKISRSVAKRVYDFRSKKKKTLTQRLKKSQAEMLQFLKRNKISFYKESTALVIEQLKQMELDFNQAKLQLQKDQLKIKNIGKSLRNRPETVVVSQTLRFRNKVKSKELESKLKKLLEKYTEQNPKVIALRKEMKNLSEESSRAPTSPEEQSLAMDPVVESLKIESAQLKSGISGTNKQILSLSQSIAGKKREMQKLASIEKEYDNIQRKVDTAAENIRVNEAKIVEAENAMNSNISNFDVVEKAQPPEKPLPTKKKLIVILGLGIGGILSLGIILLSELLDIRIKSKLDFDYLSLLHLGMIPAKEKVDTKVFYHYQNLFFNQFLLHLKSLPKKPTLILTVSQTEGEGKSFILEQLIENLNHQGAKTLYIQSLSDLDEVRQPFVLNQYLQNPDVSMPQIQEISQERKHLYFDTRDSASQRPFIPEKVDALVSELGQNIPYIFWELPSLEHHLHTANILINYAQVILCVSQFRKGSVFDLKTSLRYLNIEDFDNKWGVLNHVQPTYLSI